MMALAGSDSSFEHGREQLEVLAGLEVTSKSVERHAEAIGTDIAARHADSGMFWTVRGAHAIIALRCSLLSRRFEDYWESRRHTA